MTSPLALRNASAAISYSCIHSSSVVSLMCARACEITNVTSASTFARLLGSVGHAGLELQPSAAPPAAATMYPYSSRFPEKCT